MIEFCGTFVSPCTLEYTFSDKGIDLFVLGVFLFFFHSQSPFKVSILEHSMSNRSQIAFMWSH